MSKGDSLAGGKGDKSRIDAGLKAAFDCVESAVKNVLRQSNTKALKNYLINQKRLPIESSSLGKLFQGRPSPLSIKVLELCAEYLHENATRLGVSDRSADDWLKAIFGPLSPDSSGLDEAPEALGSLKISAVVGAASETSMISASRAELEASDSQASPPGDRTVTGRLDFAQKGSDRSGVAYRPHVDLLVMVALEDERDAILHPTKGVFGRDEWSQLELRTSETYHLATLKGDHEPLRIAVGLAGGLQGSLAIGNKTTSLISELRPRFAALVGVCAGDGELARYGDLIVPHLVYDELQGGKRTETQFFPDGFHREGQNFDSPDQFTKFATQWKRQFLEKNPRPDDLDGFVYELLSRLIEYANGLDNHPSQRESAFRIPDPTISQLLNKFIAKGYLRQDVAGYPVVTEAGLAWFRSLQRKPDPPREFECLFNRHLVTVRDVEENDDVFRQLKEAHGRYVAAVEREAIGFLNAVKGRVNGYFVAKAVQDYARFPKTDHYRMFAAKASASFAIEFVAARADALNRRADERSALRSSLVTTKQLRTGAPLSFEDAPKKRLATGNAGLVTALWSFDLWTPGQSSDAIFSQFGPALGQEGARSVAAMSTDAIEAIGRGDFSRQRDIADAAIRLGSSAPDTPLTGEGLYLKGEALRLIADFEPDRAEQRRLRAEAEQLYGQAEQLLRGDPRPIRGRARAIEVMGDLDKAWDVFEQSMAAVEARSLDRREADHLSLAHERVRTLRHKIACLAAMHEQAPLSTPQARRREEEIRRLISESESRHSETLKLFQSKGDWWRIEWFMAQVLHAKALAVIDENATAAKRLEWSLRLRLEMMPNEGLLSAVELGNLHWWSGVANIVRGTFELRQQASLGALLDAIKLGTDRPTILRLGAAFLRAGGAPWT